MKTYRVEPNIFYQLDRKGRKVYYIDYRVKGTRRRERVGYLLKEAQDALESRRTDIRRERFDGITPEPSYTLKQIRNQYLRYSKKTKSAQTYERDEGIIDNLLIPAFPQPLNEINAAHVEDYRVKRNRAPATINKEVQLLKNIVKKAVGWGKIRTNQISSVKPLKTPPGRVKWLEQKELVKLLKFCVPWLRPVVVIAATTGMRRGEITDLKKENIDRRNRLIVLERTKNNERRVIPMNNTVYQIITSLPPRLDTQYLFAQKDGSPLRKDRITRQFERACRRAGIKEFCFHDLRHHFASHLTMKGQNQRTLMELLGHKSPQMTTRYQHLSEEHLRAAVDQLNDRQLVQVLH